MQVKSPDFGIDDSMKDNGAALEHVYLRSTSPAMQALGHVIADIAPTDIPVLLMGESGSGKEVVATQIHQLSRRAHEPFVKIRCAAYALEFAERRPASASTGASGNHDAVGTVFLDDIGELDLVSQSKLLPLLPDGGTAPEHVLGKRVISATNRNLEEEMIAGRFREELYYRINGVCLRLPPLRQRMEDVPGLISFFLKKYSAQFGHPESSLGPRTLRVLMDHHWPGNIRELENTIRKIVALGDDAAVLSDLSSSAPEARVGDGASQGVSLKEAARAASHIAEKELILKVLARTRWNRKRAAKELQISYKALLYKLKQIGMDDAAGSLSPRGEQG